MMNYLFVTECKPEVLGLGDGRIPVTSITTSSEDPSHPKAQLGAGIDCSCGKGNVRMLQSACA